MESKISKQSRPFRLTPIIILVVIILPILTGCSGSKLEVYQSDLLKIKVPMLEGWEVQVETAESQELAYLTINNDYSGILVTRSTLAQIFPDNQSGTEIGAIFDNLISLGEGTFTTSGQVDIQQKSGYQQALVPIDLTQIEGAAGESKGTLLMALQGDQAVIAIFFCTVDKLDVCQNDLAKSVKGFSLTE